MSTTCNANFISWFSGCILYNYSILYINPFILFGLYLFIYNFDNRVFLIRRCYGSLIGYKVDQIRRRMLRIKYKSVSRFATLSYIKIGMVPLYLP